MYFVHKSIFLSTYLTFIAFNLIKNFYSLIEHFCKTINLLPFLLFSAFVAPTIVNSNLNNAPAVVNFGSVPVYTWSPYATLPYLQLPGWTVATVYAIIFGLFIMYMFSIFGTFIPGFTAISRALSSKYKKVIL